MSTARHHAEWLSLVEASGPFLSLPVLLKAFPTGLDAHDPEHLKMLRLAYQEWQDNQNGVKPEVAIHRAWVNFVLQQTLELPDEVLLKGQSIPTGLYANIAQHGETLRPDWVVVEPAPLGGKGGEGKVRLLVQIVPANQSLEKSLIDKRWKASPATRMMELLHACNVRLGLVTNGEHWMLVNAPRGETAGYISWYGSLWLEEHITLRAFKSLLSVYRFFSVDNSQILEQLLADSLTDQQEVTDQLGYQVRKAVEVLVQALDRIDQDRNRTLLTGISETQLYQAALTIMMRLVFLFSAEERGLLLLGDPIYDLYYAVSTIREQLQQKADKEGEEILERRYDAWCRLLATFRAVYAGVDHDSLKLPAYGGSLFDPDRFPFLEGRTEGTTWETSSAAPIPVNNRIVLHLLEALQILQIKVAGTVEPRRLSFRALDIEQIGHVYEGLLDHTAVRATSPVLGLVGTKYQEPEIELGELGIKNEEFRMKNLEMGVGNKKPKLEDNQDLIKFLKKATGRSETALKKALQVELTSYEEQRLLTACNNDLDLFNQVRPLAGLVRLDTLGYPVVIPAGSVYVTQGTDRRETGTHYTPRNLTEEIVKYTLEPLVYEGVAEGKPQQEWRLKSAAELLQLKICDMAMGSGAFLVQTCRYLAERLVEAWENAEKANPGKVVVAPEGTLSKSVPQECVIPKEADERLTVARRIIADRCLYGVDKNPLAVEMAKLSLWLITLQKNRPFTFLDHAFKCGDSLIGVSLEQLRYWNLDITGTPELFAEEIRREIDKVVELRREIAALPVLTPEDQNRKGYLLTKAEAISFDLRQGCNLLVGSYLNNWNEKEREGLRKTLLNSFREGADIPDGMGKALPDFDKLCPFHWELEFPEVFIDSSLSLVANSASSQKSKSSKSKSTNSSSPTRTEQRVLSEVEVSRSIPHSQKGFDAIGGNPPFMGGLKLFTQFGLSYRDYLVNQLANGVRGKRGTADFCAYFFLRAKDLLNENGGFGLIATNTIAQGDTREVGLDQLAESCVIYRAVPSRTWPGSASLEVAYVWLRKGSWKGDFILDEKPVNGITAFLTNPGKASGNPYQLATNKSKSFQGSIVLGMGFTMSPEEAQALIEKDPKNQDVLFPYLNGQDLNTNPDQSPSRWVINFKDWPLDAEYDDPKKPKGKPYVSDYPDCLAILEEKVKPDREALKPINHFNKFASKYWWKYGGPRVELYNEIARMERVISVAATSRTLAFTIAPSNIVFSNTIYIFTLDSLDYFTILQSMINESWTREYASSMKGDLRYNATDCFETFPFPTSTANLEQIGEKYYTHRQNIMLTRQEGLTKTYNRFHNPDESNPDIEQLRTLHIEMDKAVAAAYGWEDIDLDHDFHETKQGIRFTICENARREILDRLLQLNHQRYAEEVAEGLHDKGKKKAKGGGKKKVQEEVNNDVKQIEMF
ncbi:Eco57I restriction-modification methylase domain-containing protein [Dolichospermum heterosporum]|uniref:site-specific DNA-methyltransferase (adenine-specific) n=1 Tax=Dolichospermum heterosporum TAC447 TaxID=747523 RepID=A0ABY5LX32_9CYAN|nr:type IIL restriction-modification enzyme MmeI [Dolichospermum heterosporum]UUO15317.1 restriction endonuclease [Dolichospermum heterosporum TAC447]